MDSVEKELLEQHGFDVDGTMKRFLNNEMLYKKCLKKFLDDKSMETLKEACKVGNVEEAFKAAHTMKGFISNLGMEKLHQLLIFQVFQMPRQVCKHKPLPLAHWDFQNCSCECL